MSGNPHNEGFRYLGEFLSTAVPGPGIDMSSVHGRAANAGFLHSQESIDSEEHRPFTEQREAELGALTTDQLLAYVRASGMKMTADELRFIHAIAMDRARSSGQRSPAEDELLSQLVVDIAASRMRR
jgi:hypothetical protein